MICADQIPDEVADAIRHCFHTRGAAKAEIAAALAAWPGVFLYPMNKTRLVLPLPQEKTDD